ncbi:unnamed protein product, partial [Penicillium glandicola]
ADSGITGFKMSLLSLPLEIMMMIVSELPHYEDILDLMCTNRLIYGRLIRYLYKRNLETDPRGLALFWCASNGAIEGMNYLLSWEADVNKVLSSYEEENGRRVRWQETSALLLAVEDDNLQMADLLLRHGADVNVNFTFCDRDLTPLDAAAGRGNGIMTQLLLQKGAKIRDGITLSRVINHGALLSRRKAGVSIASEDEPIEIPGVALNYNFREVVEVLHLYGADLNRVSHAAVANYGSLDDGVVELLLDLGADVNAKDSDGFSVMFYALMSRCYHIRRRRKFAQLLIAYGAKIDPQDLGKMIEDAIYSQKLEDFELILECGEDINSLWCTEGSYLHLVITSSFHHDTTKDEFIKLLLNRGADIFLRDHKSKTPLEHAILETGRKSIAKLLLDAGAKVQCQGKEGARILTYLINDGLTRWFDPSTNELQIYLEETEGCRWTRSYDFSRLDAMISLLLEYGVCPNDVDDFGQCPLDQPGATLFPALLPWLSKRQGE